jgi:polyhydroxybutyrate depolymerase
VTSACSPSRSRIPASRLIVGLSFLSLLLGLLGTLGPRWLGAHRGRDMAFQLTWGGIPRLWIVHLPMGYDASRPLPVVFMFHGFNGTAEWSLRLTGWAEKSDAEQFIAVFPEGSRPYPQQPMNTMTNSPSWNDGSGRFSSCWANVDDVGLTLAILQDVAHRYPVDRSRVYAAGFSNGASMVYRLGIEASQHFAALGVVSASGIRVPATPSGCPPSLLAMHGDADTVSPIQGGDIPQFGIVDRRPAPIIAARTWANLLGLPAVARESEPAAGIRLWQFGPGQTGSEVQFYQLTGGGHTYSRSRTLLSLGRSHHDQFDATDVIWEYFKSHPRQKPGSPS